MHPFTSSYFTVDALTQEKTLFKTGYVGTELWAPIAGSFQVLPWDEGRMLINNNGSLRVMSNRCLHRQATMLEGGGRLKGNIICPLHLWSYRTAGDLVKAPRFIDFTEMPGCKLPSFSTQAYSGYLFEQVYPTSWLDELGSRLPSLEGYQLRSIETYPRRSNWKTFMEIYLDNLHVNLFHPGLGRFVDDTTLTTETGDGWIYQTIGHAGTGENTRSANYDKLAQALHAQGKDVGVAAKWVGIYPNITIEWYNFLLVISTVYPVSPQESINVVEFYHKADELADFPELCELAVAAYLETAAEDDIIADKLEAGRKSLYQALNHEQGPYHPTLEVGIGHFHAWLAQKLKLMAPSTTYPG